MQPQVQEGPLWQQERSRVLGPNRLRSHPQQYQSMGSEGETIGSDPWRMGLQGLPGLLASRTWCIALRSTGGRPPGHKGQPPTHLGRATPTAVQRLGQVPLGVLQASGAHRSSPRCGA